jgi:hypothetical protein
LFIGAPVFDTEKVDVKWVHFWTGALLHLMTLGLVSVDAASEAPPKQYAVPSLHLKPGVGNFDAREIFVND